MYSIVFPSRISSGFIGEALGGGICLYTPIVDLVANSVFLFGDSGGKSITIDGS